MAKNKKPSGGNPAGAFEDAAHHHQAGRLAKAEKAYRKAITAKADFFEAHVNLGVVLEAQGKLEDAEKSFSRAIILNPEMAEIHYALGTVLDALNRPADAAVSHQRALDLKPDYVEALNGLAIAEEKQGNADIAIKTFEKALGLNPGFAEAANNLGNLYHRQGGAEDAIQAFRSAIAIRPDYAEAHRNLGQALLLGGNFSEGWGEYQWRWRCRDFPSERRTFPQPLWQGEDLAGKTILVWGEQGVGDEVQFASMVPDLVDGGAKVIIESDPRLTPVFDRSFPSAQCVAKTNPPHPATMADTVNFQVPMGNLGRWLRPHADSFPQRRSFLVADPDRRQSFRQRYCKNNSNLLIGLAWHSRNPEIGNEKSMSLSDMNPLAVIPGITFIDLQHGEWAPDRKIFEAETGTSIIYDEEVDQMTDLDSFFNQLAALDMVISISSATTHFAGALGIPTWTMLHAQPIYYWMAEREDTLWYPSVRLFRQRQKGDWPGVVKALARELSAKLNKNEPE
ncbi:MAG: tetratricopeptide repeat protein [Rhodospirillales bacterium]